MDALEQYIHDHTSPEEELMPLLFPAHILGT